jgi:hypothetical protein
LKQVRKLVLLAVVGAGALAVTGGTAAAFTVTNPVTNEVQHTMAPADFPNGFGDSASNSGLPGPWNGHGNGNSSVLTNP